MRVLLKFGLIIISFIITSLLVAFLKGYFGNGIITIALFVMFLASAKAIWKYDFDKKIINRKNTKLDKRL